MAPEKLLSRLNDLLVTFANDKLDDDEISFSFKEAEALAEEAEIHVSTVILKLKALGLDYTGRETPKKVRGFQTSSNDRWFGPGSCPTAGGSGWEQISGFAGPNG